MSDATSQPSIPSPKDAEYSRRELERRVFYLKTLYDVGQVIGPLRDPQQIIQHMLLMMIGTFGARRGIIGLVDAQQGRLVAVTQRGMTSTAVESLSQAMASEPWAELKSAVDVQRLTVSEAVVTAGISIGAVLSAARLQLWFPFAVNTDVKGGIGLGEKLLGEPYTPDDQELCSTLAAQLTIALDNALAYLEIRQLNTSLEAKVRERTAELRLRQEQLQEANRQLELHNQFIRETLGRYVSDEVVVSLLASPEKLQLGGEQRRMTILIADLRGFTSVAERLAPAQVVTIVNRYLGTMVNIILEHQGTINEFIGDAILVIFGAPVRLEDHAQRAVACAMAMQLAMASVNAQNRCEGLPEVEMGVGIHTGEVVVGNIGSHRRMKYGVVGSAVNLTSRIESYTVGGQVLISEATRREVGSALTIAEHIEIEAKGLQGPITLYNVRGIGAPHNLWLPEEHDILCALPQALPLHYTVLEEKYLSGVVRTGLFVKLSASRGEIHSDTPVALWGNLKMWFCDGSGITIPGDLYGKVVAALPGQTPGFTVHFTSISPDIRAFFQRLLA